MSILFLYIYIYIITTISFFIFYIIRIKTDIIDINKVKYNKINSLRKKKSTQNRHTLDINRHKKGANISLTPLSEKHNLIIGKKVIYKY